MYTEQNLLEITSAFLTDGNIVDVKALGPGFINDTYIASTSGGPRYILQRKNHLVFPDVPGMMQNILSITEHLKKKISQEGENPERESLTVIKRRPESLNDNEKRLAAHELYLKDEKGNFWTMSLFIEGSMSFEKADTPLLAEKGGCGIGRFQAMLSDFDTKLNETIKGFHNIRWRFAQWDEAIARDAAGRKASVSEEISWIEERREEMLAFWSMVENGVLPTRVTHNDTKISNILFDKDGNVLCMIDLDTCMNSTCLNDFGDAIRSYANTGAEDDKDISNVSMSMEMFSAYTAGYLSMMKEHLTDAEARWLAFSAKYITYEQVLRFLMDYIDGDTYYKTAYPEHNLIRTRAQYKLLQSMEMQYDDMVRTVSKLMK